jgi:hypothetical protein
MGWLRPPPRLRLAFEDRPYRLGEAIPLTVELSCGREAEVVEGRVDLMLERRYVDSEVVMTVDIMATRSTQWLMSRGSGKGMVGPVRFPKRVFNQYTKSYPHGSAVFLSGARLHPRTPQSYHVVLPISSEAAPHTFGGTAEWKLKTTVQLADGSEVTREQKIEVALG